MARKLSLILLVLAFVFFWWATRRAPATEGGRATVTCPDGEQISFHFRSWATLQDQAEGLCRTHTHTHTLPTLGAV